MCVDDTDTIYEKLMAVNKYLKRNNNKYYQVTSYLNDDFNGVQAVLRIFRKKNKQISNQKYV